MSWRWWIVDGPARIIKGLFLYYWFLLAAITVLNVLNVTLYLTAWLLQRPILWVQ